MIQQNPVGWWIPKEDTYFAHFLSGPAGKQNGFMREHLLEAFKHVHAWDCAVDVGAHVGFWAWDMAQRFKTVYAFEPVKTTYDCLVKNVAECRNVQTWNVAVGECEGWCEIRKDERRPGNTGSNYIRPQDDGSVPIVTLDSMGIAACDLLKIDVEGYEWAVLRGASDLIYTYRPVISMECTDSKFRGRYDIPEGHAQKWLVKRGYREVAYMRPDKIFVPI